MDENKLKVAIIGCGDIAGGYDQSAQGEGIFSHAGAYKDHPSCQIVAAFDSDQEKLGDFCKQWSIGKNCSSLSELLDGEYDVVSVCTPDHTHEALIKDVLNANCTRAIWAEKPLTITEGGAKEILSLAEKKGVVIWLSSQRRWEPKHIIVKEKIANQDIGEVIHATGYYVKGLTHIGCTLINTLRFLLGEVKWCCAHEPFEVGSYGEDFSTRGVLGFEQGMTASIIGCDASEYTYSIFEIDIIATKGRIRIQENGDVIKIYTLKEYDHYEGFKELHLDQTLDTEMKWTMKYGLNMLVDTLTQQKYSNEFSNEGLIDLKVVQALKKSAATKGSRVDIEEICSHVA